MPVLDCNAHELRDANALYDGQRRLAQGISDHHIAVQIGGTAEQVAVQRERASKTPTRV